MHRLLFPLLVLAAAAAPSAQVSLDPLGTYATGLFDEGAAEIIAFDPATDRAFFVNAEAGEVQAISLADPENPELVLSIDLPGGGPNSVAVADGIVAVAVAAGEDTDAGEVRFYATDGTFLNAVTVGVLPDAVAFSTGGRYLVVANEGEPSDELGEDGTVDPEGTVSVIDLSEGAAAATVRSVGFADFNVGASRNGELDASVLIDPRAASVAQDIEPEYVAVHGGRAFVTLQENNAIAEIDLATATVVGVYGLGFKDYSLAGNGIDPSDRDDAVAIRPVPVLGAYQPDALAVFEEGGTVYLVTANEGDARDGDEARVADLDLDPTAFPDAATLQADENLGRLEVRPSAGDTDGDGDQDRLVSFGARSFTVYAVTASGLTRVFDSGDDFEQITAQRLPDDFNADNDENDSFDSRSDAKGPEPEAVAVATLGGSRYAFVGLERIGGVMVYDITDPANATFVDYVNNRDFSVDAQLPDDSTNPAVGDLGPEAVVFVSGNDSPTRSPLLLVANEVSGTVTAYAVERDAPYTLTVLHNNDGESDLLPDTRTVGGLTFEAGGIARFGSVVERLRDGADNVLLVSSGDNFLAGPVLDASRTVGTFYDAVALDLLDYDASAVGNHEFDEGPDFFADFVQAFDPGPDGDAPPPFVSANLDFSGVPALAALAGTPALGARTVVEIGGRRVGIVGATTPELATISNPGDVVVLQDVAAQVQAEIDALEADGVEIIGLVSHLQSVENDRDLVAQLTGLDFAVAGGGDELLADDDDLLIPGDEGIRSDSPYPILTPTSDGGTIPVVTTVGGYDYVGRLVLTFNEAGEVIGVADESGPVRVVSRAVGADGVLPDATLLEEVEGPVADLVDQLRTVVAQNEPTLDATRQRVRTEETNFGSLIADALLAAARDRNEAAGAPEPDVAIQNGGGIRNSVVVEAGAGVTRLDVGQVLPFPNFVTVVADVPPAQLKAVFENAVSAVERTSGRFAQVAGLQLVYDPARTAREVDEDGAVVAEGERVRRITLDDGRVVVRDGEVVDGAPSVAVATIDFLVTPRENGLGGDEYPFVVNGNDFFVLEDVTYQEALLEYLTDDLGGVVSAEAYPEGGLGRIVRVGRSMSDLPIAIADFDTDAESVTFANAAGSEPVDLAGTTFVVVDPMTEQVSFALTPAGTLQPGGTFVLATSGGDADLPPETIPDGPGAFALLEGTAEVGDPVGEIASQVVAAVVYRDEDDVFGAVRGGEDADAEAFLEALAALARATSNEGDGAVALALTTAPNPTRGRTTVGFGLAEAADVRVALYDVLGREVAVLAEGPFGPGRHAVALRAGSLPAGAYIVRVATGAEVRTSRLTVVR
jgi:2',3'-cyclic-nucleotide 2'-phosphodiesterase (5'-nucleotidase family)